MRPRLYVAVAVLTAVSGCCQHGSSTGWRFEVLSPPVVMSPSIVASGPAPIGTVGLGTIQHTETQAVQLLQQGQCVQQTPIRPMASIAADCTLDDACRRIAALEAQLRKAQGIKPPEMAPMPRGAEKPPEE